MAIDTAEKRKAVAAIPGIPFAVSVTPNATPDQEWRQEAGWGYPGILAGEAAAADGPNTLMLMGVGRVVFLALLAASTGRVS